MRIISAEFIKSAVVRTDYPRDRLPEIILIGRSNVGKSSLINTLVNRRGLAKTSSAPGKTRTVNFYRINKEFYFVDLPGFGYAKVPASVKKSWELMVNEYLEGRETIKGALVVLDIRRDPTETEARLYEWVSAVNIPVVTVLTKTDKLPRGRLAKRKALITGALPIGDPVLFSAHNRDGRITLVKRLDALLSA